MKPEIKTFPETKLAGMKISMSLAQNRTGELWQRFMANGNIIVNRKGNELYSIEIYSPNFFRDFNRENKFEKWAALEVSGFDEVPEGMETLTVPQGLYAVFLYRGRGSEIGETYQYILGTWLPDSKYTLDERPHMAIMGEKYKNENPESEEELWIPVREK